MQQVKRTRDKKTDIILKEIPVASPSNDVRREESTFSDKGAC